MSSKFSDMHLRRISAKNKKYISKSLNFFFFNFCMASKNIILFHSLLSNIFVVNFI